MMNWNAPRAEGPGSGGFGLEHVDQLMRQARDEGAEEAYSRGLSEGQRQGYDMGAQDRQAEVMDVVRRELNWTLRGLAELDVGRLSVARRRRFTELVIKLERELKRLAEDD